MRIVRYLGSHKLAVFLVFILLMGQAFCDLMLPNYTSQIVDVGIQQAGVESVAVDELSRGTADAMAAAQAAGFDSALFADSYAYDDQSGTYHLTPYGRAHRQELEAMMARPLAEAHGLVQPGMADDLLGQVAVTAARDEYRNLGYDMGALQLNYLATTGLSMMGFVLVSMVLSGCVGFIAARTGASIGRDLRSRLFAKVVGFSDAEVQRFSTASLITRGTNDIQQIQMMSVMLLRMVLYAPILAIGGIIMVARTDASMGWLIGVAIVAVFIVMGVLMAIVMPKMRIMQKLIDRVNLVSREMISGVSVVRAFGQQDREQQRFDGASTDLMRTQLFTNRAMTFMMPLMALIMNLLSVGILWFGAGQVDAGAIQTGDLIAFITYAMVIVMGFLMLSMLAVMAPRADVAAQRVEEVLEAPVSIADPAGPAASLPQTGLPGAALEFQNVSFGYGEGSECVLRDISFAVQPGQTCAFIGSTGSGKTTLLKLVERFYDVDEGRILLDGVDIRTLKLHDLRSQLGYVPQKSFLFSGTIASNTGFGGDVVGADRLEEALEIAQAAAFVAEKEEGMEAPITQGGTNVSGGQRQRLAIARALATDARLFLFDDCFSALDYKTDAALRRALRERLPGRTQLIVAQRIATVMAADAIIVLDDGRIVGQGTHSRLLAECPQYREIAQSQLSPAELQEAMADDQAALEESFERAAAFLDGADPAETAAEGGEGR